MKKHLLSMLFTIALVSWVGAGEETLGPKATPEGIVFTFEAPGAKRVTIAGEFNSWSPESTPLKKIREGVWQIVLPLKPGRYEYKFVIDGKIWKEDPHSPGYVPDPYGGRNSVITVLSDGSIDWGGARQRRAPIVGELKTLKKPIYLAILWHQHQPRYFKDPDTGEYTEPWVRIHGIKDYYEMVAILEKYPDMKFTVDLTPVLLTQLLEIISSYEKNSFEPGMAIPGCDKWVRLTLTPPEKLTQEDKIFILKNFFRMPRETMIDIYPRFAELASKKLGDSDEKIRASIKNFSEQDWRDLQVWFNLAEFDPDFKEGSVTLPDGEIVSVKHLVDKGRDFTEEEKREVIESQFKILKNILPVHKKFQERGQIEVITCPFYHPILPLICDVSVAKEANPQIELPSKTFKHPEDAMGQIEKACEFYRKLFGRRPEGMWPSEGAVSQAILPLVAKAGLKWIASDEGVLAQSLGRSGLSLQDKYRMYYVDGADRKVAMIFRDHELSDDIGFRYSKMNGTDAANDMIRKLHNIAKQLQNAEGDFVVPIIMDGENAWEHFERDGKEFLNTFYSEVSQADWIIPVTISEFLKLSPPRHSLSHLSPGSWIGHTFDTWIGEEEENTAWDYLAAARDFVGAQKSKVSKTVLDSMMEEIYIAEGSDWFWWYGLDQGSGNDEVFDRAFTGTLARVYEIGGESIPDYLGLPIVRPSAEKPSRKISGMMKATVDGHLTISDEWNKGAYVDDIEGGTMARALGDILGGLYYGYDSEKLFLRIDINPSIKDIASNGCLAEIYLSGGAQPANAYVKPGGEKIFLDFAVASLIRLNPTQPASAELLKARGKGEWQKVGGVESAFSDFFEISLPFADLELKGGESLRLVVGAICNGKLEDRIPDKSYLELKVPIGGLKLLRSIEDPIGDDDGPGYYTYPTDPVFEKGSFDMTSLEVLLDENDNVIFKIGVRGNLSAPWGGITGYSLQAIDIYIDADGIPDSGTRDLFRARKARTVRDHAWEYFVRTCMDTVAIYNARGVKLGTKVKSYPDAVTSSIYVTFPGEAIKGGKVWNVIVAMLGHDGYSFGQIRPVQAVASQWYFGGCDDEALCPSIIDLIIEPGLPQHDILSAYRRTHELVELEGIRIELP